MMARTHKSPVKVVVISRVMLIVNLAGSSTVMEMNLWVHL